MDLIRSVRDAIEAEGHGPSVWRKRDCISIVRAVIAAHGVEPSFRLPAVLNRVKGEAGAIRKAVKTWGSLRDGWLHAIGDEPALVPYDGPLLPGLIGLTADEYALDGVYRGEGAAVVVYGPELIPLARTPSGLSVAHPVERLWKVTP